MSCQHGCFEYDDGTPLCRLCSTTVTPDRLAEIKAKHERRSATPDNEQILTLCDALEEAWAERDHWVKTARQFGENQKHWLARAERAEEKLARVRDLCDRHERFGSTLPYENLVATTLVRAAIDGET